MEITRGRGISKAKNNGYRKVGSKTRTFRGVEISNFHQRGMNISEVS